MSTGYIIVGRRNRQNENWATENPFVQTRSREQHEGRDRENPQTGATGTHSHNVRKSDISMINQTADKTHFP